MIGVIFEEVSTAFWLQRFNSFFWQFSAHDAGAGEASERTTCLHPAIIPPTSAISVGKQKALTKKIGLSAVTGHCCW